VKPVDTTFFRNYNRNIQFLHFILLVLLHFIWVFSSLKCHLPLAQPYYRSSSINFARFCLVLVHPRLFWHVQLICLFPPLLVKLKTFLRLAVILIIHQMLLKLLCHAFHFDQLFTTFEHLSFFVIVNLTNLLIFFWLWKFHIFNYNDSSLFDHRILNWTW